MACQRWTWPSENLLGAAMGSPDSFISASAIGWDGILIATVSRPAVISSGIMGDF